MYSLMCFQTSLVSEILFTHITGIWTLPSMYASMSYQNAVYPECLVTHIT